MDTGYPVLVFTVLLNANLRNLKYKHQPPGQGPDILFFIFGEKS